MQMLQYLRAELAPKPGRLENVLRITTLTVLLVIFLETLPDSIARLFSLHCIFYFKGRSGINHITGIIVTLSITISVFLAIGIYMISANEPGLRLPLMAIVVFAGMFISRASPLGTVGFLIGFLVTIPLTLIDFIPPMIPLPSAEILTRSVLWLWVVTMLPVAFVIIANIFTGRNPADLFNQGLKERLELAGRLLTAAS